MNNTRLPSRSGLLQSVARVTVALAGLGACSPAPESVTAGETGTASAAVTLTGANLTLSAGAAFTCAIEADGNVECSGDNHFLQLGSSNPGLRSRLPVLAPGTKITSIASGGTHTCSAPSGGGVRCWGRDDTGPLGGGSSFYTYVAAGREHSCAIRSGDVYCWGSNYYGQLGRAVVPAVFGHMVLVPLPPGEAIGVTAGARHTCAVLRSGDVHCWGDNGYGQLGNGSAGGTSSPVMALMPFAAARIGAGDNHTCAITTDGAAYCWGDNTYGQVGVGPTFTKGEYHSPVGVDKNAKAIATGAAHTCVADARDPEVRCWGKNDDGQLGDGTTSSLFSTLTFAGDVVDAVAGERHTCVRVDLLTGGRGPTSEIYCWGYGGDGQLGNGRFDNRLTPTLSVF